MSYSWLPRNMQELQRRSSLLRSNMQQCPTLSKWSEVPNGWRGAETGGVRIAAVAPQQRKVTPQCSKHFKRDCCTPPPPEKPASPLLHGEPAETDMLRDILQITDWRCYWPKASCPWCQCYLLCCCLFTCCCRLCINGDFLSFYFAGLTTGVVCTQRVPPATFLPTSDSCHWKCPHGIPHVWGRYFCHGLVFIWKSNTLKPKITPKEVP